MIEEYKKNGYVIFDNLLPEKEYKKILDICKNSSYIKISQKRADRYLFGKHRTISSFQIQTKFIKINFGELMM